jgi:hypothetical protein
MTIAYVADDGLGGTAGIKRYTNNGSGWGSNYTLTISGSIGARGLVVDWSGAIPVIYATTVQSTANRVVKIVDTGASATPVTLATAPASTAFRGVALTPVQSFPPTIITNRMLANQTFEMTFSGTPTLTYRVLASSNLAAPLATWTVLAAGMFDANGSPVTFTDTDVANHPLRFYRIASP